MEENVESSEPEDDRTYGEGYEAGVYDTYAEVLKDLNQLNLADDVVLLIQQYIQKINSRYGMENTNE